MHSGVSKSTDSIREILRTGNTSVPPYVPSRVYDRKRKRSHKPPKRWTFSVTFFNYPNRDLERISESNLVKIGQGTVALYENNTAEEVKAELLRLLISFPITSSVDIENIDFFYMKKDGRKKVFSRHHCSSSSAMMLVL